MKEHAGDTCVSGGVVLRWGGPQASEGNKHRYLLDTQASESGEHWDIYKQEPKGIVLGGVIHVTWRPGGMGQRDKRQATDAVSP